jgi:uncharacterized membrane protein
MNTFAPVSPKLKGIFGTMLLLSLVATAVTVLLILTHYDLASLGGACNIDDYYNCDKVNGSSFATFYGIPVAILGLIYYLILSLFSLGALCGFDFGQKLKPLVPRVMLHIGVVGAIISTIGVTAIEYPFLGAYAPVALAKAFLLIAGFTIIYRFSLKHPKTKTEFYGVLALFALFGVSFSLYLTDIELFVLNAVCLYCVTQQILIIFITALSVVALKAGQQNKSK